MRRGLPARRLPPHGRSGRGPRRSAGRVRSPDRSRRRADVDEDAVVARLLARAADQGRADDTEEVIRERMAIYRPRPLPLTAIYREHGVLREVDGMGSVDEVNDRIAAVLDAVQD
jgi:adenylate kinase family enzyme